MLSSTAHILRYLQAFALIILLSGCLESEDPEVTPDPGGGAPPAGEEFTCEVKTDYDPSKGCSNAEWVATNMKKLERYQEHFGSPGQGNPNYMGLRIKFDIEADQLKIHSPCHVRFERNSKVNAQNFCVDGRKGVRTGRGFEANVDSKLYLISEQRNVEVERDATLLAEDIILDAKIEGILAAGSVIRAENLFKMDATVCRISDLASYEAAQLAGNCLNQAPEAVIEATPLQGYQPLEVEFSAQDSFDPDGEIVRWTWSFPDGSTQEGEVVSYLFEEGGTQQVSLEVEDDLGAVSNAEVEIEVLIDETPPSLQTNISDGETFYTNLPYFEYSYSDLESGLDRESFKISLNEQDVTDLAVLGEDEASLQFSLESPLPDGQYLMRASISDQSGNETVIERELLVEAGLIEGSNLVGRVVEKSGIPLQGVKVHLMNEAPGMDGAEVFTDEDGYFEFPLASSGQFVVAFEKRDFSSLVRRVETQPNIDKSLGTLKMVSVDPTYTLIDAETGGEAENSTGTTISFPPGALNESVEISTTDFSDTQAFPGPLPELSQFTYAFDVSERSTQLNEPLQVEIANTVKDEEGGEGFPIGTELVLGQFHPDLGLWLDSGVNWKVEANDEKNESDTIQGEMPFLLGCDANQPAVSPDSFGPERTNSRLGYSGASGPPPVGGGCTGCRINMESGNLAVDHQAPGVTRFGETVSPEWSYNSLTAWPHFSQRISYSRTAGQQGETPLGARFSIDMANESFVREVGEEEFNQLDEVYTINTFISAKNSDEFYYPSGVYTFNFLAEYLFSGFFARAAFFGAPAGTVISRQAENSGTIAFIPSEPLAFGDTIQQNHVLVNNRRSGFGAGWTLNGHERLHFNPSGHVLLAEGRGDVFVYENTSAQGDSSGFKSLAQPEGGFGETTSMTVEQGHIFIADCQANRVYKANLDGQVSVVAGTGERGFSGDGGAASDAKLNCPSSVVRSLKGDLYIADSGNFRIRKIDRFGQIETYAGNGESWIGEEGEDAREQGIGRPMHLAVDKLMSVYFTTSRQEVMMVDPRQKLRTYSASDEGYIPFEFERLGNLQMTIDDRLVGLDREQKALVEFRALNKSTKVLVDLDDNEELGQKEDTPKRLNQMTYDKKNGRYFFVDDEGRLFVWNQHKDSNKLRELIFDHSTRSLHVMNRRLQQKMDKGFVRPTPIKGLTYSALTGLVLSTGNEVFYTSQIDLKERELRKRRQDVVAFEYLSEERDTTTLAKLENGEYRRFFRDGTTHHYDEFGRLTAKINLNDQNYFYEYNNLDRLSRMIIPGGDAFEFVYDERGFIQKMVDPVGRETLFEVNEEGQLTKITNPDNTFKSYAYDERNLLLNEQREGGHLEEFEYIGARIVKQKLPGGRENIIRPVEVEGIGPEDQFFNKIHFRSEKGDGRFPSRGGDCWQDFETGTFIEATMDCLGRTTRFERTESDVPTRIISPEGREIEQDFVDKDLVSERIDGSGQTEFEYSNEFSKVSKITDAQNFIQSYSYDPQGNLSRIVDQKGENTSFSYNASGLLTNLVDSAGEETQLFYDANSNLTEIKDPLGNSRFLRRDELGRVIKQIDANSFVTELSYDSMNRVTQQVDPRDGVTSFDYTPFGKIASVTDANENTTSYTYNEFELVSKEIYPNELEKQFFYDDNERLTQVVQEDGSEINYSYNLAGELEVLSGSDFIKEFERDKDSLVTLAQNQDAETHMSYDEFSRLERVDDPTTQIRLEYSYNERGERSQMRISRRGARLALFDYQYSKTGKLKEISANVLNQSITWQRSFDERDLPTQDLLSNSQRVVYDFDAAQRLTLLENLNPEDKVISSFGYSYSPRGNITQIEQAQGGYGSLEPGTTQLDFSYDETGQLVSSTLDPEGLPNLDLLGNPTGVGYQTNSLNQLLETPRYQLKYDLRGNLIEKINKISGKLISFEWNTENKLVRAQIYDNTDTLISELAYRYDALDRRVFKKLAHHQQPNLNYTRYYVYDGEDLIMELNADQNPIAFYVHAEGVDNPIAMLRDLNNSGSLEDEEVFFFTKDHLGSIREITNLRGEVLQRYDYKSYGEAKITKNDRLRDRLLENAFAFTGREVEIELGVYYYRARYYNPSTGRWMQKDPIGFAGGDTNLYRYVGNDPISRIDPAGLSDIIFDRDNNQIIVIPGEGVNSPPLIFPASNRARNMSVNPFLPEGFGPAPSGTFNLGSLIETGQGANDPFGSFFVPVNLTPQVPLAPRTGVGIHAGRASSPRGAGFHGTLGCIRTTEEAGNALRNDPATSITIR